MGDRSGRFWLRAFLLVMGIVNIAAAQEQPSHLRYAVPDGWTPSLDGKSLMPPGGNSAVTFAPSTPFDGTAEQWSVESWNNIAREMTVLSGPVPGTQGAFVSRIGYLQHPDGRQVWLCLNTLVEDGRGESVILIAGGDAEFRAHLPALSRMLAQTKVASPAGAATVTAAAASPASAASHAVSNDIPGLYLASTAQYRLNPLGGTGSGSMEWRTEFYLLSRDGRVFRGPDLPNAPGGDISRFDYEAARREAPSAYGTYVIRGREVVLTIGHSPQETIVATRPLAGVLEIRGTRFKRSVADKSR